MSLGHGASVVRDGLVLHLDAANIKSYPGTGTAVNDLSGNNHDCTMLNGVSISVDPINVFSFDGVDDIIRTNSVQDYVTTQVTAEIFVKVNSHGNFNDFVRNNWVNSGWLLYASSANWVFGIAQSSTQYNAQFAHNNESGWAHITGTYDGSSVKLYINGELKSTNESAPDGATLDSNVNIDLGSSGEPSSYKIGYLRIYDRGLSDLEIKQNFEALRGRYGI